VTKKSVNAANVVLVTVKIVVSKVRRKTMPKFYRQNKKRIDPRYFLEETTNRDNDNLLEQHDTTMGDDRMNKHKIGPYTWAEIAAALEDTKGAPPADQRHYFTKGQDTDAIAGILLQKLPDLGWSREERDNEELVWQLQAQSFLNPEEYVELDGIAKAIANFIEASEQGSAIDPRAIALQRNRNLPGDDVAVNRQTYGSDYHPNDPRSPGYSRNA